MESLGPSGSPCAATSPPSTHRPVTCTHQLIEEIPVRVNLQDQEPRRAASGRGLGWFRRRNLVRCKSGRRADGGTVGGGRACGTYSMSSMVYRKACHEQGVGCNKARRGAGTATCQLTEPADSWRMRKHEHSTHEDHRDTVHRETGLGVGLRIAVDGGAGRWKLSVGWMTITKAAAARSPVPAGLTNGMAACTAKPSVPLMPSLPSRAVTSSDTHRRMLSLVPREGGRSFGQAHALDEDSTWAKDCGLIDSAFRRCAGLVAPHSGSYGRDVSDGQ